MAKKVKEPKEKHTLRTVLIVIAVILVIGIIGGSMGDSDDEEKETGVETESSVITEAVTEAETESEMTVEEALQKYVDSRADGWFSQPQTINREDIVAYLSEDYSEEEAEEAVASADIDWKAFAVEYENYLLKSKEVYHEDDLREELALKAFTQEEIDYAIENVDWTLQNDILDFVTEYEYEGIDDSAGRPYMFWNVYLNEDADTEWYDEISLYEVAMECMEKPESKGEDVDGVAITVYDADGQIILMWDSYDEKYTVTQFVWRSSKTNPERYEWELSTGQYYDIVNTQKEE